MKTKEQIRAYNKEYSSRPEVIAWAKIRNARPERKMVRNNYKKTTKGKEANKRSRAKNWDKDKPRREKVLLWRYGLSKEQYDDMVIKQNGACAICSIVKNKRLSVDHCHETGRVRGLLCIQCNMAIGLLRDNTKFLSQAIEYLSK
jgi:hypothetical protein